nr:hypothetical protein [Saprospiraceae bacterium]
IYLKVGNKSEYKKNYIKYLNAIGSFPEKIDTAYCNLQECEKYIKKRDPKLFDLIVKISDRDQKYRAIDMSKQRELDQLNIKDFNDYVDENGWPTFEKTGNNRVIGTFISFLHHIPDEQKIKYIDSCIIYAQNGKEAWRRSEILISKLIADNSIKKNSAIYSLFNNCDSIIDDLEVLEIFSVLKYSIKSNKKLNFFIEYNKGYEKIANIFYEKAIALFPEQQSQMFVRDNNDAIHLSSNGQDCISIKIEKK